MDARVSWKRNRSKSCGINGLTDRSPPFDHCSGVLLSCPDVFLITHLAFAGGRELSQDDGACLSEGRVLIIWIDRFHSISPVHIDLHSRASPSASRADRASSEMVVVSGGGLD